VSLFADISLKLGNCFYRTEGDSTGLGKLIDLKWIGLAGPASAALLTNKMKQEFSELVGSENSCSFIFLFVLRMITQN
jgi:hypothetical protein